MKKLIILGLFILGSPVLAQGYGQLPMPYMANPLPGFMAPAPIPQLPTMGAFPAAPVGPNFSSPAPIGPIGVPIQFRRF